MVPIGKTAPGVWVEVVATCEVSVAVGGTQVTADPAVLVEVTVIGSGQPVITGGVLSTEK